MWFISEAFKAEKHEKKRGLLCGSYQRLSRQRNMKRKEDMEPHRCMKKSGRKGTR